MTYRGISNINITLYNTGESCTIKQRGGQNARYKRNKTRQEWKLKQQDKNEKKDAKVRSLEKELNLNNFIEQFNHENPDKIVEETKFKAVMDTKVYLEEKAVKEKEAHQIRIAKFKADAANRGIREEKVAEFLMAKKEEKVAEPS